MVSYSDMAKVAVAGASLGGNNSQNTGSLSKAELGGQVVSQTLSLLNKGKSKQQANKANGISPSFQTQMDILNAGAAQKGIVINSSS